MHGAEEKNVSQETNVIQQATNCTTTERRKKNYRQQQTFCLFGQMPQETAAQFTGNSD